MSKKTYLNIYSFTLQRSLEEASTTLDVSGTSEGTKEVTAEIANDKDMNVKVETENGEEKESTEVKTEADLEPAEELVNILSDIKVKVELKDDEDGSKSGMFYHLKF